LAQETVLHLLTKRRQDLVPGGARRNLTAKRAAALLATVTPTGAPAVTRWQLADQHHRQCPATTTP